MAVPDAARLRVIAARVSTDEWRSWPRESRTFSGLAAERSGEFTRLGGQVLHTHLVSANYFQVLRVPMAMGRTLTPDDASDAAVISYALWQRRFRTDPEGLRSAGLVAGLVFITLIACANVSNLMLASGYARRGEVALRLALGGRRGGIIRQLLIESFVLSLAAGGIGVVVSSWLPDALLGGLLTRTGVRFELAVDGRVIVWSLAVSILACVVFGLAPALRSSDLALGEALKESQDNSRRALMPSLLSYQTIVSVMAIVIAALMLRSAPVAEARRISSSLADLSVVRLDPLRGLDLAERQAFVAAMIERLSTVAGESGIAGMVGPAALPLMRGLAIGSAGAGCLAAFMRRAGLPAGINPLDPLAYVAVAGLLAVTVASYAPTRRALRIEPIKALRVD